MCERAKNWLSLEVLISLTCETQMIEGRMIMIIRLDAYGEKINVMLVSHMVRIQKCCFSWFLVVILSEF